MAADAPQRSAQGADDTSRHGGLETERAADGHHQLPDAQTGGVAEFGAGEIVAVGLDHGQVSRRVGADDSPAEFVAGGQAHLNAVLSLHDMVIGEQEAIGSEDHARAGTLLSAAAGTKVDDGRTEAFSDAYNHAGVGVKRFLFFPIGLERVRFVR